MSVIGDDARGTNIAGSDCCCEGDTIVDGFVYGHPGGRDIRVDNVVVIVLLAASRRRCGLDLRGFRSRLGCSCSLLRRRLGSLLPAARRSQIAGFNDLNRHSHQHQYQHRKRKSPPHPSLAASQVPKSKASESSRSNNDGNND